LSKLWQTSEASSARGAVHTAISVSSEIDTRTAPATSVQKIVHTVADGFRQFLAALCNLKYVACSFTSVLIVDWIIGGSDWPIFSELKNRIYILTDSSPNLLTGIMAKRIDKADGVIPDIRIDVDSTAKPNRVFGNESA